MRSLRNVVSSSESSPVGLNLSEGETSGPWRQPAYTHETGEVVLAEATGKRQHVWDLWDVWKQHRIPSSVSRLNREIGGWLRPHSVLLPGATLSRISKSSARRRLLSCEPSVGWRDGPVCWIVLGQR
jgi:hypothetical protein